MKDKLVLGENISQTASFVVSGSADVGIVALSLALSPNMKEKGRYAEIGAADYPPIEQACVILSSSKNKQAAREFLAFVKTAAVAEVLRHYASTCGIQPNDLLLDVLHPGQGPAPMAERRGSHRKRYG